MSIPKLIHYIWVGGKEKPDIVKKCIDSWKKYLPDYELIEWNETNYDVYKNEYISEAYKAKKWAFVSDYMRFDILFKYGGIYFDTDVEIIKRFPDEILNEISAFTGKESSGYVSPGLVFGCEPQNSVVKKMIESYDNSFFDTSSIYTVNQRLTDILTNYGYTMNDEFQKVIGLHIFPSDYFCGYDLDCHVKNITSNTLSFHHYEASSWQKYRIKNYIRIIVRRIIGLDNYKKILQIKRKYIGISELK